MGSPSASYNSAALRRALQTGQSGCGERGEAAHNCEPATESVDD